MKALFILLLASVGALGQQGGSGTVNMDCPPHQVCVSSLATSGRLVEDAPKPLKCGKYEHVVGAQSSCPCNTKGCTCLPPVETCAPIMHEVTEKEWQHLADAMKVDEETIRVLVERLKQVEKFQHDMVQGYLDGKRGAAGAGKE